MQPGIQVQGTETLSWLNKYTKDIDDAALCFVLAPFAL